MRASCYRVRAVTVVVALGLFAGTAQAATPSLAVRRAEVSRLLDSLRDAPDELTATALEIRIRLLWQQDASPAGHLLLERGDRDLQAQAFNEAQDDYNAVLTLDPGLSDALVRRAQVRVLSGRYAAALSDLQAVLAREPRHFVALSAVSQLAETRGDWPGALAAWQRLLAVDPQTALAQDRLTKLRLKAEGEPT